MRASEAVVRTFVSALVLIGAAGCGGSDEPSSDAVAGGSLPTTTATTEPTDTTEPPDTTAPPDDPPSAPTLLRAEAGNSGEVTLVWTVSPEDDVVRYVIERDALADAISEYITFADVSVQNLQSADGDTAWRYVNVRTPDDPIGAWWYRVYAVDATGQHGLTSNRVCGVPLLAEPICPEAP